MVADPVSGLKSGVRSAFIEGAVHALPLAHCTPLRNVMAVSLLVEQLERAQQHNI